MVWYGMVWYGMVWYGMVWYGMVWYGMRSEIIFHFVCLDHFFSVASIAFDSCFVCLQKLGYL